MASEQSYSGRLLRVKTKRKQRETMNNKISAGLLMYRQVGKVLEIFLAHPGGPYFFHKDDGYWGIPKGLVEYQEDLLTAARREFLEETGITAVGKFITLGQVVLRTGKTVHAWAFYNTWDETRPIISNYFELEWPPRSGKIQRFPEIDRAQFFPAAIARQKINRIQCQFIDRLEQYLSSQ